MDEISEKLIAMDSNKLANSDRNVRAAIDDLTSMHNVETVLRNKLAAIGVSNTFESIGDASLLLGLVVGRLAHFKRTIGDVKAFFDIYPSREPGSVEDYFFAEHACSIVPGLHGPAVNRLARMGGLAIFEIYVSLLSTEMAKPEHALAGGPSEAQWKSAWLLACATTNEIVEVLFAMVEIA